MSNEQDPQTPTDALVGAFSGKHGKPKQVNPTGKPKEEETTEETDETLPRQVKNPKKEFLEELEARRRPTMDETHKRATFLVKRKLLGKFEKFCHKQGRGYKTWAINRAIELFMMEYDKGFKND